MLTRLGRKPNSCSVLQHNSDQDDGVEPSKSTENWELCCRLCAKEDRGRNFIVLLKNEQQHTSSTVGEKEIDGNFELVSSIEKYFSIRISNDDNLPKILCYECSLQITSFIDFVDRVAKVQEMYLTLKNSSEAMSTNTILLRSHCLDVLAEDVLTHQPSLDLNCLETNMSPPTAFINIYEMESRYECDEKSRTVNPLEQPRITTKINKEHIPEDLQIEYPNIGGCADDRNDKHDDDSSDEWSFDNDSINEIEKNSGDDLLISNSVNPTVVQLTEGKLKKSKRKLRVSKDNDKNNETAKKHIQRKSRLRKNASNKNDANDSSDKPCSECSRKFKSENGLRCHLSVVHSTSLSPQKFTCPQCSRDFSAKYRLKQHLITHLPDEERTYQICSYCNKKFTDKYILRTHIKHIHKDERPFVCDKCGVAVRTIVALEEHLETHSDYAPFKCEMCENQYKNKYRLKAHMETHYPEKHRCTECGLQLKSRETLKRHQRVHSDEMRYKCDYCGRAFKHPKSLKHHLILHAGFRPYSCHFCDRTFTSFNSCTSHMKTSHSEEFAALKASGGGKMYARNLPSLAALKAITRTSENLLPVTYRPGRVIQYKKLESAAEDKKDENAESTSINKELDTLLPTISQ